MEAKKYFTASRFFFSLISLLIFTNSKAQIIQTYAGNGVSGYSGDGGQATAAELDNPTGGVARDVTGNLYIAAKGDNYIRKVNPSGIISTIAGTGVSGYSGDGGQATAAELNNPYDVAMDGSGNLYIADELNSRIRKINNIGVISTFAGNGHAGYTGDGGQATAAEINEPLGITVDATGNIYFTELGNDVVRKVNTSGVISTIAGNGVSGFSGDTGPATASELDDPFGVAVDPSGIIYIADEMNYRVRKVSSGTITTYAGNGTSGNTGNGGQATAAELMDPAGVAIDASGNVYVVDEGASVIREISVSSGVIKKVVGVNSHAGFSGDGGLATAAELDSPHNIAFDNFWNYFVVDDNNNRVRVVYTSLPCVITSTSHVSCHSGNNGSVSVSVLYGTTPYTYSWSPGGGTNSTYTGLTAGTYTLTVTDNVGITGTISVTITQPATALSVSASVTTNETCGGGSNGSLSSTASGGTSPYTYSWSPGGGTNSTYAALTAGTYTITVTDHHGCTATASATITEPATLIVTASVTANVTCYGGSNGSVSATPTNGASPYTYLWTGGSTNSTESGLSAGTYTITLTDHNGCTATATATITQPTVLSVSTSVTANVSCYGGVNGGVSATPSGGISPYTYLWSNGATNFSTSSLSAATYTITVTDAHGCTATASATVTSPTLLVATITSSTNETCYGESVGSVTVTASGGTTAYSYNWSPSGGTAATATGLSAGTYTVTVTDANDCTTTATVTITQPPCVPNFRNLVTSNVWVMQ